MPDRVCVDAEGVALAVEAFGARSEHALLRLLDVVHADVEVELLGAGRVRPLRRDQVGAFWKARPGPSESVRITTQPSSSWTTCMPSSSV
ncbi:hypothetical protein Asp14428_60310 [Actinoplanes sp. NBRC 14428]|nr:hypothetical protein Asp14428_60310 [Actinoplanes sp. NBRC 14428]